MNLLAAIILGIVEGLTEFLPISSTGHLTIVEKLLGFPLNDPGITAFTAIVQVGSIGAVIVFFWRDITRLFSAWFKGLRNKELRGSDYRLAWFVIIGSVPIGLVGFLAKDLVSGPLRNLWVVVFGLVVWSIVMWLAERTAVKNRGEAQLTAKDGLIIGIAQCFALVPGVSRSGATISTGLFLGLDRVTATRVSFFLSIPALVAAGSYEAITSASDISVSVGWGATLLGTIVSFGVAYAAIAWLLKFVAHHSIAVFIWYRIGLAAVISLLLATGVITAA